VTGPTGATGVTGSTGPNNLLSGLQVQLKGSSGGAVNNNSNVLFDTVINAPSPAITYNAATGTFVISQPGNYYISWWVNTNGAGTNTFVDFAIRILPGGSGVIDATSPTSVTTLQLNGNALIPVTTVPLTFSLFNNTGVAVTYGTSPVQADLTIIQVT
jgi:hypothetical protein